MYYCLEPEVAGQFGERTVADFSTRPPRVTSFHYILDGWLGDDMLEVLACYVVTEQLQKVLQNLGATGCEYGEVEVSVSEQFRDLYPTRRLPKFRWLKVLGKPQIDDVAMSVDHRLIVSQKVFDTIRESCNLNHCEITPITN